MTLVGRLFHARAAVTQKGNHNQSGTLLLAIYTTDTPAGCPESRISSVIRYPLLQTGRTEVMVIAVVYFDNCVMCV